MSKKFYVVWKGVNTGVFSTWSEVQANTQGRSDAQFMGFPSKAEAESAFASTYTKALMKRSLSNKSATSSKKAASKVAPAAAQGESADIQIYCDGACSPNPGKSGTGLALYQQGKPTALYYGLYNAKGTNNTAELNGMLMSFKLAQKQLKTASKVQILSDSKYSIDCITKWAKGWQAKGWTRGKGEEIKNVEQVKECFAIYQVLKSQLIISHVRAHADIEGNELADRMAVLARKEQQASFIQYQGDLDVRSILAMESG